ncbi:MAG TPA: CxxxxCH/CxxCH domain-containing protein, partial [bacterium]
MRREDRQHEGGRYRRIAQTAMPWLPAVMALAWLLAGEVRPAAALHYVQEGLGCYSCHTLDAEEGEPNTSFINRTSRTVIDMKVAYNPVTPTVPAQFGCTYCHNIGTRNSMKAVLGHFSGKASMHPVGKNFATGVDTSHEYTSTWGTSYQNELDCVDCHDVEGLGDGRDDVSTPGVDESTDGNPATSGLSAEFGNKYPEHGRAAYAYNPYMLRSVTAANQYDPLCRVCHGNTAPRVKGTGAANDVHLNATSAHADGVPVGSGGSGPIVEDDGTQLKTTAAGGNDQCRSCHDTHYSSKQKLFNDGHEHVNGTGALETALDVGTDCTSACHYPGDAAGYTGDGPGQNTFTRHGHGMPTSSTGRTLNFGCGNCHTVNAQHDSPYTDTRAGKMFASVPDPQLSSYGKSQRSICYTCHGEKIAHNPGGSSVGCVDCHDEHAEGVGATSNIMMIPQQLPNRSTGSTELTIFEHNSNTTDFDYYINDNSAPHVSAAGICDNGVCHAGVKSQDGTDVTPLSTLMSNNHHSGQDQLPLSSCTGCHDHDDTTTGGSFGGAGGTCNSCHGYPPNSLGTGVADYYLVDPYYNEGRTPHQRHAGLPTGVSPGYNFSCRMCHYQGTNGLTHRSSPNTYRSIWFDPSWNPSATAFNPADPVPQATPNYTWDPAANGFRCSQIYCHSNGSSTSAVGTAVWMTGFNTPDYFVNDLKCDACHGDGNGDGVGRWYPNDAAGNHARHVGKNVGCENCHYTTTTDGTTINVSSGQHVDRTKDVSAGGHFNGTAAANAVTFGWTEASKTCDNVSCHSGRRFTAAPITWNTVPTANSCTDCHNNGTADGNLANSWPATSPTADEHPLHAGTQSAPTLGYAYACTNCHPNNRWDGGTSTFIHENLDKSTNVVFDGNFVAGGTFDASASTCSTTYCHGNGTTWVPDWDDRLYRDAGANTRAPYCDACHGTAGLTTGRPNSPAAGGRHTGTAHAALACTSCHPNDNANHALHAQGPAQSSPVRSDAGMAATVDTAPYWRAGTASTDQGFLWTGGTCGDMTTGCHPAAAWGQPAGCALCHGNRVAGTAWPDGTVPPWPDANPSPPPRGSYYFDDDAGSHETHIAALRAREGFTLSQADQTAMCAYCHPAPGSALHRNNSAGVPTNPVNRVDVLNDSYAGNAGTFGRIDAAADLTMTLDGHTAAAYNNTARTCSASDCHYEKPTPSPSSIPAYASGWDSGDSVAPNCESCHFTRGVVNSVTYPTRAYVHGNATANFADGDLPDAHITHVGGIAPPSAWQGLDYPCAYCHDVTGYTTAHVDGSIGLSPAGSPNRNFDGNTTDEAMTPTSTAVKYGTGANTTCTNLYCHGADFGALTQGIDVSPVWNSYTTGSCGDCHDVDTENDDTFKQPLTQGAHATHMAGKTGNPSWGPGIQTHANRCNICHGSYTLTGSCENCHGGSPGGDEPGTAPDQGRADFPSRSHVNGSFALDFEGLDRNGRDAFYALGYAQPGTVATLASTDVCNRCHSTATVGGSVGATVAKTNWPTATRITDCLLCHNTASPATQYADGTGTAAPAKDSFYAANGHGNSAAFSATLHGQSGPGYACQICHTENAQHITGALGQTRLETIPAESPALAYTTTNSEFCLGCHKVGGTGVTLPNAGGTPTLYNSVAKATVHSGGVNNHYNTNGLAPQAFPAYGDSASAYATNPGYQCDACHDPHGTPKVAMVLPTLDGHLGGTSNPVAVSGFASGAGDLTGLDPTTGTNDGVCDACHRGSGDTMAHPDTTPPGEAVNGNHFQGRTGSACMACHSHSESFQGSCARCHGNETTGQIWPDGNPANNSGQTPQNAYADTEVGSHTAHIALLVAKENFSATSPEDQIAMCAYCHPNPGGIGHETNTTGSPATQVDLINDGFNVGTYKRIDGVSDLAGANDVHTNGTYNQGTKTCSGMDCHYEKPTPAYGPGAGTVGWDGGNENTPSCATCHTDDSTYNAGDLPNAHAKHVDEIADGGYNFACAQCHPAWASTQHLNGAVDIAFTPGSTTGEPGGVLGSQSGSDLVVKYGQTDGGATFRYATCIGLYCHGADSPFPASNGGSDTTPVWDTPSTGACGTCHGRTAAAPPRSNAHIVHAGNTAQVPAGYSLACNLCHYATTTNGTSVTSLPAHVNYSADVAFDGSDARLHTNSSAPPVSAYLGDAVVGSGFGACNNTYCHSPGTDRTKPFTIAPNTAVAWNVSGATCAVCHGAPPAYADGTSVEGTPKANKHARHEAQGYTECLTCHSATVSGNSAIASPGGFVVHVNATYNAAPNAANGALNTFTYSAGTCSTTNCHGGNSVAWSATTMSCDICHGESGGSPVDGDVNNFAMRDWTQSKVDAAGSVAEYGAAGHGVKGVACSGCHSSAVNHDATGAPGSNTLPGSNPFRLIDQDGNSGNGVQFSCTWGGDAGQCHDGSPTLSVGAVHNHSSTDMVNAGYTPQVNTWGFTPQCLSCHDPHGDQATGQATGNLAMIQRELYETAFNVPAGPPPAAPTEQTDLVFTNLTGVASGSYAWTNTATPNFSGVCQECHETADPDFPSFRDGVSASVLPHPDAGGNPGDCVACHPHSGGFRPPGCSDCHGNATNGTYWPDGSTSHQANHAGRHPLHIQQIAARLSLIPPYNDTQQKQMCEYCHAAVTNDDDHGSTAALPAEVFVNTVGGTPTRFAKRIWSGGADADAAYDIAAGGTCATVDCHNNKTTTNTPGVDFSWNGNTTNNTTACVMCHTDVTTETTHTAHTNGSATFGYGVICSDCHNEAIAFGSPGTPPSANHLNGSFTAGSTTVRGGTFTVNYTGFAYPGTKGTCGTNICHTSGYLTGSLVPPRTAAYSWGTTIAGCQACHEDTAALASYSHPAHLTTTTGGGAQCGDCHTAGSAVTHLNASVNFGGAVITADAVYTGDRRINVGATFGTCGLNTCHNNGQAANADSAYTWGTVLGGGTNSCSECHGTAASMTTQAHPAHLAASALFGRTIGCTDCHGLSAQTATTHANGTVNFRAGGVAFTYGAAADAVVAAGGGTFGSCGTNACHNNGSAGAPNVNPYAWDSAQANCTLCHQDGAGMVTNAHDEHLRYPVAPCTECHASATAATHINQSVNLSAANVGYSRGAAVALGGPASGTCTTANCHNRGAAQSAAWNTTGDLACDACHYWSAVPTVSGDTGH